jgi:hypothetical protein
VDGFPEVEQGTPGVILHCTRIELWHGGAAGDKRARSATFTPDLHPEAGNARSAAGRGEEQSREEQPKRAKGEGRAKVKKGERHQHFVAWLCATYGEDALRADSGVVDLGR